MTPGGSRRIPRKVEAFPEAGWYTRLLSLGGGTQFVGPTHETHTEGAAPRPARGGSDVPAVGPMLGRRPVERFPNLVPTRRAPKEELATGVLTADSSRPGGAVPLGKNRARVVTSPRSQPT